MFDTTFETLKSLIFLALSLSKAFNNLADIWFLNLGVTLLKIRESLMISTQNYLAAEPAALVNSMVFGGDSGLSHTLDQSFKVIGMQHVMAASGFNVGLMVQLCRSLLSRFGSRKVLGMISLVAIWSYVVMAGGTASVVRAGMMLSLTVVGSYLLQRQTNVLWVLGITVATMLSWNHEYLTDIGFQLSVTSSLGLILVTPLLESSSWLQAIETGQSQPLLEEKSAFSHVIQSFKDAFFTTLAAQSLSLPVLWYHFGEISLLSLPANTFLLWLTPLITLGGVGFMAASALLSFMPNFLKWLLLPFAWCLEKLTQGFIWAVEGLGRFSGTLLEVEPLALWQVLAWWLVILALVFWRTRGGKGE